MSGPAAVQSSRPNVVAAGPSATSPPPTSGLAVEAESPASGTDVGLLVMAHGGSEEWNASVLEVVAEIGTGGPAVVAFGMAEPSTLQQGLDSLTALGVERVAVVRLFVSGQSFYTQTAYLLGLSDTKPEFFMTHANMMALRARGAADAEGSPAGPAGDNGGAHGGPVVEPSRLSHDLTIATHRQGLMGSPEVTRILLDRALQGSRTPGNESVLLLAHGMGDEAENEALLSSMRTAARRIRDRGFVNVEVKALREDWPEARARASDQIRQFVSAETAAGRAVVVVPYRLSGFGPYESLLEGLDYTPTEGLLPHDQVSSWIRRVAEEIICGSGWGSGATACPRVVP